MIPGESLITKIWLQKVGLFIRKLFYLKKKLSRSSISKGPFIYYVITEGEGGGLQMITMHVIVSNTTTVKVITEGEWGLETGQKLIT